MPHQLKPPFDPIASVALRHVHPECRSSQKPSFRSNVLDGNRAASVQEFIIRTICPRHCLAQPGKPALVETKTQGRPGAIQQHPAIGLAYVQFPANFACFEAHDFPHGEDACSVLR